MRDVVDEISDSTARRTSHKKVSHEKEKTNTQNTAGNIRALQCSVNADWRVYNGVLICLKNKECYLAALKNKGQYEEDFINRR